MQADNISTVSNTELRKIPSATLGDWPEEGTFKSWYSSYESDPTGDSNPYFRELKAQLLKDLQCAKHEQDEVENNCIFVKKRACDLKEAYRSNARPCRAMTHHPSRGLPYIRHARSALLLWTIDPFIWNWPQSPYFQQRVSDSDSLVQ